MIKFTSFDSSIQLSEVMFQYQLIVVNQTHQFALMSIRNPNSYSKLTDTS